MVTKFPLWSRNFANICVAHIPSFTPILCWHIVFSHILISACVLLYNLFIRFFDHLYYLPNCIIGLYFRLGSCMFCRKVQFHVQVLPRKVKLSRRLVLTLIMNHEGSKQAQHFFQNELLCCPPLSI